MSTFTPLPTAQIIEAYAKKLGLSIPALCSRAGMAASTFYRWRNDGSEISVANLDKMLAVLNAADVASAPVPERRVKRKASA